MYKDEINILLDRTESEYDEITLTQFFVSHENQTKEAFEKSRDLFVSILENLEEQISSDALINWSTVIPTDCENYIENYTGQTLDRFIESFTLKNKLWEFAKYRLSECETYIELNLYSYRSTLSINNLKVLFKFFGLKLNESDYGVID